MFWTLVTDLDEAGYVVEKVFTTGADGIKAWKQMRRSRAAYSTTLWRHSGNRLHEVCNYDKGLRQA